MTYFRYIGLPALEALAMAALEQGVEESADDFVGIARVFAPTLTGALDAGIDDEDAKRTGRVVRVKVATHGPSNEYAIYEHESTYYQHDDGQRKFIEQPLLMHPPRHLAHIAAASRAVF